MTKKLSLLFFICILSALNINAEVYEDLCGDNVEYSLDTSTGLLSITGTGAMTNYDYYSVPWYSNKEYVKTVEISDGVTSIGSSAFNGCEGLTSITIGNSVTSIGEDAFYYCSGLTSVTIPNSVTSIGNNAFMECSGLTSIEIPNSVTSIGHYAFSGCSELAEVYCYAEQIPTTGNDVFKDSYINYVTLYVPASAVNAYKTTTPWSEFGSIVALPEPTLRGDANGDGEVNMDDATFVTNIILGTEEATEAADVNNDGTVSMPDAMFIVNKILNGKFPDEE